MSTDPWDLGRLTRIGLWLIRALVGPGCLLVVGMILYTLSVSSHGFVFWFFSPKYLIPIGCAFPFLIDAFGHTLYMKHRLSRGLTTSFCLASIHTIKLELDFDTIYRENSWTFPIHISMIMSILGLNFHGLDF